MGLFHITTRAALEQAVANGEYRAPSLTTEGFIHLSGDRQWLRTANRLFRARAGLVLLSILRERLRHVVRDEAADGDVFPHLYGPLNVDAVIDVFDLPVEADGSIGMPARIAPAPAVKPTSTLVIEGGGLRGAFSVGVVAELAAAGVPAFDDVVAVSSGAPTAAYLATGQADDAVAIWSGYTHGSQLIALRNLPRRRPLMDIDRLVGVFQSVVPLHANRLASTPTRLWVGVTDCRTGRARAVVATPHNVFELLRATMALPVANGRVVEVDRMPAIDGGVAAPVPLDHALGLCRDRTLIVLTRPRGYRRRSSGLSSWLIGWTYPRYPAVRRAMARHRDEANAVLDRIEALERARAIAVIRPDVPLPLGRLSRDRAAIEDAIAIGREAARNWLRVHDWS